MKRKIKLMLISLALLVASSHAQSQPPRLRDEDRIRIAEAFKLSESIQDSVWEGWSEVPFVLLLVTPEHEFLFRHPCPTEDFSSLGFDELLASEVHVRPNSGQYSLNLLATFPAIRGVNTVVIGQPENTAKNSTQWVIVAMHEHFHQLQYTRPWYYDKVAALNLADGDSSGMWQLNYPFPYGHSGVGEAFKRYTTALETALAVPDGREEERYRNYLSARTAFRERLSDADYRYMSFQIWQEGIARYTEYAVAQFATDQHRPLSEFTALDAYEPYSAAAQSLYEQHTEEMTTLDLASWKRTVFYPVGASEGLLLDMRNPGWKSKYFADPFFVERYH